MAAWGPLVTCTCWFEFAARLRATDAVARLRQLDDCGNSWAKIPDDSQVQSQTSQVLIRIDCWDWWRIAVWHMGIANRVPFRQGDKISGKELAEGGMLLPPSGVRMS
jgi:hypothetical protein